MGREFTDDKGERREQPERDGDHSRGRWVLVRKTEEGGGDDDE